MTPIPHAEPSESLQKPLSRLAWWAYFLVASFVMSLWFEASRTLSASLSWLNGLHLLAVTLLLAMILLVLVYDSYVQEKSRGRIHHPMRLFEWLIQRRFLLSPKRVAPENHEGELS